MKRSEKQQLIENLKTIFEENSSVLVVHYKGLTVSELEKLRKELHGVESKFKVVKNNIASIALKDTSNSVVDEFLVGPTAIVYGNDPVSTAKIVSDFSKSNNNLAIVGGSYNASKLSVDEVKVLATLPSHDELRGKLVGLLVAAQTKLAILSRTPATNVVGVLKAYSEK